MQEEFVVLVNEKDQQIGLMEKQKAHELGELHRAFSIFIFNNEGALLLQQRASSKYHSPNLWSNTCCSHPREGESLLEAASRRLWEEMGMKVELCIVDHIIYRAKLENNLIEHEYDYILIGKSDVLPKINENEVKNYKYLSLSNIKESLLEKSCEFTEWFKIIFPTLDKHV